MSSGGPSSDASGAEREVVVQGAASGFRQHVHIGGHELGADEPTALGGTDTGPSPYELLLSALGACTSMTVSLYARRKGIPLDEVIVRLTHSQVAQDGSAVKVDRIRRDIELVGELSAEQRSKLLEIGQKCPVHRTLSAVPQIETTLAEPVAELT
jgi:putative redox protein